MKYGIISDIHSNLEALVVVLAEMEGKVDKIACIGDIVGYGPQPNECVERIKELNELVVVGNHDLASIGLKDINWFNEYAQEAIIWTDKQLTMENKLYLTELPEIISLPEFIMVHGSLNDLTDEYITNVGLAKKCFDLFEEDDHLLFVGHTHHPLAFFQTENGYIYSLRLGDGDIIDTLSAPAMIINVGAVGQPRDGDSRAGFGIFDTNTQKIEIKKIPYNVTNTQQLMAEAGLPRFLINRLSVGR